MNVRGQVPVAQIKPVGSAVGRQPLQRMERFPPNPPAFGRIDDSRQRIRHNVEIRRNFQPVQDNVIPGVDDDAQRRRVHHLVEPKKQLRRPDAAAQRGYRAAFENFDGSHESP